MKDLSLIPYLEPGEGIFYLDIAPSASPSDGPEHTRFPFRILNDADPFSRLYEARIVSGPGRTVLPLFLLAQSNYYKYTTDQLRPLSNLDLERFWQQTYAYVSADNNLQNRFFPLKESSNSDNLPVIFRPLFFCSHRHRYFHPPCPACGNTLELCRNDELLVSKGLLAYSSSLRRYLYCPDCHEHNTKVYVYDREEIDPLIVKNRRELIRSWKNIVTGRAEARDFPCTDCPEQADCFGKTALSGTRIIPFLFYPSPILVFDAASMNAADFLAMVSGATIDDIIPGLKKNNQSSRIDRLLAWRRIQGSMESFLFSGKPEQFLEILYLKLAFLTEISGILLGPSNAPVPIDIFSSFDALWISLPEQNGLLPCFWNFKTSLFTAGPCGKDHGRRPENHPSRSYTCLGTIWFVTLLRNKYQTVGDIKETLDSCFNRHNNFSNLNQSPQSAPENNFWDPGGGLQNTIPEPWRKLWIRALSLGQRLLQNVFPEDAPTFVESFLKELEDIRTEIKETLFFEKTEPAPARPDKGFDTEIHRILSRISGKWQMNRKSPPVTRQPVIQEPEEETLTQTVMISKNTGPSTVKHAQPTAGDEIQETVILKKNTVAPGQPSSRPPQFPQNNFDSKDDEDDLAKTVILRPSGKKDLK